LTGGFLFLHSLFHIKHLPAGIGRFIIPIACPQPVSPQNGIVFNALLAEFYTILTNAGINLVLLE
jgi:hypothetical protein